MLRRLLLILGLLGGSSAYSATLTELSGAALPSENTTSLVSSAGLLKKGSVAADYPAISAPDSLIRLSSGDQLRLRWWGIGSGDLDLVVDTRGDLIIPDMGRIGTRDRNFRQVRDSIEAMLRRRIKPTLIDVQITRVSKATIRVSGLVPRPGLIECGAGSHVSQVLKLAGLDLSHAIDSLTSDLPGLYYAIDRIPSLRKVMVVRGGKDTIWVDLLRALRFGDPTQDPLLFEGDAIRVVPRELLVSVTGGAFAGYVEMIPGESIANLMVATGESDTTQSVEIMNSRGQVHQASPKDVRADSTISLVRITQRRQSLIPPVVWVIGQVNRPGAYAFSPGMKASDLVKLSGGVVGGEDSGVVVTTKKGWNWLAAAREKSLQESFLLPELKVAMSDYFLHMRGNYSDPDVMLQIGDTVWVFKAEHVVWVGGKVNRPGFVTWKKGADVSYYVNAAGGYSPRAWENRTQVLDWQTLQVMGVDQPIRPGAAVIVPEERFIAADQWFSIAATTVSLLIAVTGLMIQLASYK